MAPLNTTIEKEQSAVYLPVGVHSLLFKKQISNDMLCVNRRYRKEISFVSSVVCLKNVSPRNNSSFVCLFHILDVLNSTDCLKGSNKKRNMNGGD